MKTKFIFDLQRFSSFSGGDGSANNPYQIKTVADLNQLSSDVKGGNNYSGKFFKLANNITLDGTENNFTPIGVDANNKRFGGTFDGNSKKISVVPLTPQVNGTTLFSAQLKMRR